jgi:hypothetical protein
MCHVRGEEFSSVKTSLLWGKFPVTSCRSSFNVERCVNVFGKSTFFLGGFDPWVICTIDVGQ